MLTCDQCQPQLLAYVYDLLEPDEQQAVEAHLRGCPACEASLQQAREQAGLLALAVKEPHTDVTFHPPAPVATPASTAPTVVLPRVAPARRPFYFNRWAVAASLLTFLFASIGAVSYLRYRSELENLAQAEDRLARAKEGLKEVNDEIELKRVKAQKDMRAIQDQIDRLMNDWKRSEDTVKKLHDAKQQAQISIIGPKIAMAGGNNRYQIQWEPNQLAISNSANQQQADLMKSPQKLQVRAINARTQEVLQERNYLAKPKQQVPFDLGQNVPLNPADPVALEVILEGMGVPLKVRDHLTLAYPEYVTHLATDRPMYRPGEVIRFRSLTLDRFTLRPSPDLLSLRYRILSPSGAELFRSEVTSQLVDEAKKPIVGPDGQPVHGVGAGEFRLPERTPAGRYTLAVAEVNDRFPEEKRDFLVHLWRPPLFDKEITFHRGSYGPGELVRVNIKAVPLLPTGMPPGAMGGGAAGPGGAGMGPPGAVPGGSGSMSARIHVAIDGSTIVDQNRNLDANGNAIFDFNLPPNLGKGEGAVSVTFFDGSADTGTETLTRAIPLATRNVQIDFYPEGGDLVAGLLNRVYVQARSTGGLPADFRGRIVDDLGREMTKVQTQTDEREPALNQGLALCSFTPERGRTYELKLDSPLGVNRRFPLPKAKIEGVVLHASEGVVDRQIPVEIASAGRERELLVGAYCRGRLLDHVAFKVKANEWKEISLKPMLDAGGVYRVTVFEKRLAADETQFIPVAERLVFRKQKEKVQVSVGNLRSTYESGAKLALQLDAFNEHKQRVPALAMVAVMNHRMAKLADDRSARSMPTHFLLTTEIRRPEDLENADVLLGDHPRAAQALDLLLGSQGWRRFAEQAPEAFQVRNKDSKLLATALPVPQPLDSQKGSLDQLDQKFVVQFIDLQRKLSENERIEEGKEEDLARIETQKISVSVLQDSTSHAQQRAEEWQAFLLQFAAGSLVVSLLLLGCFLLGAGLRRLADGRPARKCFFSGVCLLVLLFLSSVIGSYYVISLPENTRRNHLGAMLGRRTMNAPMFKTAIDPRKPEVDTMVVVAESQKSQGIDLIAAPMTERDWFSTDDAQAPGVAPVLLSRDQFGTQPFDLQKQRAQARKRGVDPERQSRAEGDYRAILRKQVGRRIVLPPIAEACVVRVYAYQHAPAPESTNHRNADTVYWNPLLVLANGKGEVTFDLPEQATHYDVVVLSHTLDGRLGADVVPFAARPPFRIEAKTPDEIGSGDVLAMPVTVTNLQDNKRNLQIAVRGMQVVGEAVQPLVLEGKQTKRVVVNLKPIAMEGPAVIRVQAKQADGGSDTVERTVKVVPEGVLAQGAVNGMLRDQPVTIDVPLPDQRIDGTLQMKLHAFPSALAQLQYAFDGLRRSTSPTFEHSAAVCELSAMILDELRRQNIVDPSLEAACRQQIDLTLPLVLACEVSTGKAAGGFDAVSKPALPNVTFTAEALTLLRRIAPHRPVDEEILGRAKQYLLDHRRDKALDGAGKAELLRALIAAGAQDEVKAEIAKLATFASTNPYEIALSSLALQEAGENQIAKKHLQALSKLQRDGGSLGEVAHASAKVETTGLSALAWLRSGDLALRPPADRAVQWLLLQRDANGGFGSPRATTRVLQAISAHAVAQPRFVQPGEIHFSVQNQNPGDMPLLPFGTRAVEPLTLTVPDSQLSQKNRIVLQVFLSGNNQMPFTLSWSCRLLKAENAAKPPLRLSTKLSKDMAREGESVKLSALIENKSGQDQREAVAVIGLPSGLTVPNDPAPLLGLVKSGELASWRMVGRELTLLWRVLPAKANRSIELDLTCTQPGQFAGPAGRIYRSDVPAQIYHAEPLAIRVEPRDN